MPKKGRKRMLTIAQAAARLGVHQATLRDWADKGKVPHVRLPSGYRRFDPDRIDALLASWQRDGIEDDKRPAPPA